ncbi:DUF6340 family protein [Cytophaga sp. FL35]|uniref:DUF6340 family protein n=1 Tax=Cytophaga sp. FL35 TaxID=1904456 RepID=UPI0016534ADC|nr:DUF6340 family protein [Cytophaga sp. FL35]MBC6999172.1 hypothetical protein [Cytophaga sp. FL35]
MSAFRILLTTAFLTMIFTSCSSTSTLTMGVLEPARINVPNDVVKVGLINRSLPSESNKTVDKIDKILSLEGLNLDKEGAEAAVSGLYDELTAINRFESVKVLNDIEVQKKGLGVFPAALSWQDVEKICEENGVDALLSLEMYDTDTKVNFETKMINIPNNLGIKANVPGHKVTLFTTIKNGWRVYNPNHKIVLDEIVENHQVVSHGEGINPMKAVEAIIGRKEAVLQTSTNLGSAYASDLRPLSRRVTREYFVKGTDNFKIAQRRAQTGDWDGAADLWEREVQNPDMKIAGRACYNMAIINEINGDLNKAMEWASRSYADYEISNALRYVNILKHRMSEQRILDKQLAR